MERAAPDHFLGDEAKPALNLVEPRTAGRGEMEVETTTFGRLEPALHGRTLMRTVVVENEMQLDIRGHVLLQLREEFEELRAPVARQTRADHFPIQDIERRKQGRGAVARVVVRLSLGQSRSQRQDRRRPIERLNLALFINAEDQPRSGGWR